MEAPIHGKGSQRHPPLPASAPVSFPVPTSTQSRAKARARANAAVPVGNVLPPLQPSGSRLTVPDASNINAEEVIRNRFQILLDKIHRIASKLDNESLIVFPPEADAKRLRLTRLRRLKKQRERQRRRGLITNCRRTNQTVHKRPHGNAKFSPGSSAKPRSVMTSAQLEIPKTLVELLASENRPAVRAILYSMGQVVYHRKPRAILREIQGLREPRQRPLMQRLKKSRKIKGYKKRRQWRHQGPSKVAGDQGWGLMRLGVISYFIFT